MAESLVKSLTGGEDVTARFLYCENFEFRPQLKLWMVCNDCPVVRGDDSGMWRRIVIIPFDKPIACKDKTIRIRLQDEVCHQEAVLAWAVAGCLAWQKDGLALPNDTIKAADKLKDEMDPFARFIRDRCKTGPDEMCLVRDLRSAYETWCEEESYKYPLSGHSIRKTLESPGYGCRYTEKRILGDVTKIIFGIHVLGK